MPACSVAERRVVCGTMVKMKLTDDEKAMLDGSRGPARQKAMELLVRYAEALGAERFVDTNNIAGVPGSSSLFLQNYYKQRAGNGDYETIFSLYDLDSDVVVPVPKATSYCCHLQGGMDPELWPAQGMSREAYDHFREDEAAVASHGIQLLKTCTPYLAGNVPVKGEHCAWMESSAVVFLQLGDRGADQHRRPREHQRRHASPARFRIGAFIATSTASAPMPSKWKCPWTA